MSVTGSVAGTLVFMPRQQVLNFKYAKPDVDVWAAAASLYYMLTGEVPRNISGDPIAAILTNPVIPIRQRDRSTNRPFPKQNPDRSKAHRLDCAFFNYSIEFISIQEQSIDSVRAAFMEGDRLFPDSAIFDLAHIQIAIRNPALITASALVEI